MEFGKQSMDRGNAIGTFLFEFGNERLRVGRQLEHVVNDAQHREFIAQSNAKL